MVTVHGKLRRMAWMLMVALLICQMIPALAESVMLTGENEKESLRVQVVPDEVIEIDEYDIPYGLPETPACWTHYGLLIVALGLGVTYTVILQKQRKRVHDLEKQLEAANHA